MISKSRRSVGCIDNRVGQPGVIQDTVWLGTVFSPGGELTIGA